MSTTMYDKLSPIFSAYADKINQNASDITDVNTSLGDIESFVKKTIVTTFETTQDVVSGDYKSSTKILDVNIPSGQMYTIHISTTATRGGNITIYAIHSDTTSKTLTYNAAIDTDLTYTAEKDVSSLKIYVAGGGFTSSGTLTFTAQYSENTTGSLEAQFEALATSVSELDDKKADRGETVKALSELTIAAGRISGATGDIDTSASTTSHVEVDVSSIDKIVFYPCATGNSSVYGYAFYDSENAYISGGGLGSSSGVMALDVPDNAVIWRYGANRAYWVNDPYNSFTFISYTDTLAGVQKDIEEIQSFNSELVSGTNILYSADQITVDGSEGNFIVPYDVTNPVAGYDYMLAFEKIEIENNNRPCAMLRTIDSNGNEIESVFVTDVHLSMSIRATAETEIVRFYLYPNYDGSVHTGVYTGIKIYVNGDKAEKKLGKEISLYHEDLPAYYYENGYIQDKADAINTAMDAVMSADDGGAAFYFITDAHWTQNCKQSLKVLSYLEKHCYVPLLFDGGDTDLDGVSFEYCTGLREAFPHEIHHTMGNHDYYHIHDTDGQAFMCMDAYGEGKDKQIGKAERHYYYVDHNRFRIRFIVLNSNSVSTTDTGAASGYEEAQCTWLQDVALATVPDGYGVVVIGHVFADLSGIYVTRVLDVVDTAKSGGVDVICCLQGHLHYDYVTETTGGIPIITTNADKAAPWIDTQGRNREPWQTDYRTEGTITEQCFDVHFINRTARTIKTIRIGMPIMELTSLTVNEGADSTYTAEAQVEERTISY